MGKEKITLLGYSWGSLFGANLALEYPEYYDAFIGTGQFIDYQENEKRLYEAAQKWSEGGTDYNIFTTILFNPNYTIGDFIGYVKNSEASFEPYMDFFTGDMSKLPLAGRYDYLVPYYNINGDMDYQINYWLACEYFKQVNAPEKEMFVMKDATHGLLESRSEEFSEILHKIAEKQR